MADEVAPRRLFAPDELIEFITDVEGNLEYFNALVSRSKVLIRDTAGDLSLCDRGILVFGGDVCDRGSGDIRITKQLLALKRKFPDQVVLLQGNRDVSKLRFGSELHPEELPGSSDRHYDLKYEKYIGERGLSRGRVSACKWMLCTMGCESPGGRTDTFGARAEELRILGLPCDDESVVDSFYESVNPAGTDPWMLEYLRQADALVLIGDCVFVHAGIDALSLDQFDIQRHELCPGLIGEPDQPLPGDPKGALAPPGAAALDYDADKWAAALRKWVQQELEDYSRNPRWQKPVKDCSPCSLSRGAGTLAYYCTWTQWCNSFTPVPKVESRVTSWLRKQGLRRIFQGHKPHGDCAVMLRHDHGVCVWHCDTSYSDLKAEQDTRGQGLCLVHITVDRTTVSGILAGGEEHGYDLPVNDAEPEPSAADPVSLIGRRLQSGECVATMLTASGLLRCIAFENKGYTVKPDDRSPQAVAADLAIE